MNKLLESIITKVEEPVVVRLLKEHQNNIILYDVKHETHFKSIKLTYQPTTTTVIEGIRKHLNV